MAEASAPSGMPERQFSAATLGGATVHSFHTTGHELARTFTEHADRYFAMSRASTRREPRPDGTSRKAKVPMPFIPSPDRVDSHTWSVATWSTPLNVEFVTGATALILTLLRTTHVFAAQDRSWMLTGTLIATLFSAAAGAVLCRCPSPRARGVGLSLGAAALVVLIVGVVVAFFLYS